MAFLGIHSGSWTIPGTNIHLPDIGTTEAIAGLFGQGRNAQGGSQLRQGTVFNVGRVPLAQARTPFQQRLFKGGVTPTDVALRKMGQKNNSTVKTTNTPPPSTTNTNKATSTTPGIPNRDWSNPANWGFEMEGHWFQTPQDYYNWLNSQKQPSPEQLQQQVDNAYAEASGIFNQMRQNALANKQDFLNQYTQPYEAQKPLLAEAERRGLQNVQRAEDLTRSQEESALAAARRLYSELMQGVRQRYGGVNSAGKFANEFYGRELMRQKGNLMNTAAQNLYKLEDKRAEIEKGYQARLQSLAQQEQAALLQAKNAFRDRLNAIDSAKAELAQNKAAMKLDALRNYRAQQQAIQNAFLQHKMQLDSMVKLANLNLRNAIEGYKAQIGKVPQLYTYPTSFNAPMLGGGQTTQTVLPTGYLSFLNRRNKDNQLMIS